MKQPLISVITICRNSLCTLQKAHGSLESQRFKDFEYIVIDAASTDGTKDFLERSPIVTSWVSERDRGISDALNKGIAIARGRWVLFLHSNDWLDENGLESLAETLRSSEADIVSTPVKFWDSTGSMFSEIRRPNYDRIHLEMSLPHTGMGTRRTLFEKVGGFDLSFKVGMDYEFCLRAIGAGAKIQIAETPFMNMSGGGTSDTRLLRSTWETAVSQKRHLPFDCSVYFRFFTTWLRLSIKLCMVKIGIKKSL
jgi:glycosyltransferase involved in cell wall biosynthesis